MPGVVYSGGSDAKAFQVSERDVRSILSEGAALFDLEIDGSKAVPVVIKEAQHHPVRGSFQHLDLMQVNLKEAIQAEVAIELEGVEDAPGVKGGGVLEQVTRELNVEALPTDIPENITIDVAHLEAAATMHLAEVTPPEGVVFLDDPEETIIATITIPTEEPEEPEVEEETELVGEGEAAEGAEAEAQAEGATGDEAEAGAGPGGEES